MELVSNPSLTWERFVSHSNNIPEGRQTIASVNSQSSQHSVCCHVKEDAGILRILLVSGSILAGTRRNNTDTNAIMTIPTPPKKLRNNMRQPTLSTDRKPSARSMDSPSVASASRPPSLLAGLQVSLFPSDRTTENISVPPRPRRLWSVSDTAIRPIPPFYPPMNRHTTIYVSDAPPSVVAVRIAECLRIRSVSVEYDDESLTATALTIDRVHFSIHLWQGRSSAAINDSTRAGAQGVALPDFSHGVVVECIRLRGDVISYHRVVQAVLQASLSLDTGKDRRLAHQCSPLEYPRLNNISSRLLTVSGNSKTSREISTTAIQALEHALQLLRKDRLDAQQLGMERLVALTDVESSGSDVAMYTSLAVVGAPLTNGIVVDDNNLTEIYREWIYTLLVKRTLPGDRGEDDEPVNRSCVFTLLGDKGGQTGDTDSEKMQEDIMAQINLTRGSGGDEHHGGIMRALALRAFTNALNILATKQPKILESVLTTQAAQLVSRNFLEALMEDVQGASRPPAVVVGTRLSSQHETALAVRCLRILGEFSDSAKRRILSDETLAPLQKARLVGKSTHLVLEEEAGLTYKELTEDERSC